MASTRPKSQEKEELVIEEEIGTFHRTTEQVSPSRKEKRKREDETPDESPNKYRHVSDGNRSARTMTTTRSEQDSLTVPFWKNLNYNQSSNQFHTTELGCFSLLSRDNKKECFEDKRYLRIYKYSLETLNVNFDLKVGQTDTISETTQSKNIDAMLWWLSKNKEKIYRNNQFLFDFLSWRGVIRLIMFSIYEKHSDWLLAVIKYKNAYFLCEYVTDMQIKEEQNMTEEHKSFCYYGHKFEEYVTKNYTPSETLNPLKQFTGVFQSTIGSYRLLYGAEMDCVIEKSSASSSSTKTEHIELKVCAGKSINDLPFQFNRKFAKWWIQCFLVGIRTMIIGLRDNNGIVNTLSPLNISDIERATRTWSRQSCFNFFNLFADFIKKHVKHEYSPDQKDVTLFYFSPSSQKITVTKSSDPKYHFLHERFLNEFK